MKKFFALLTAAVLGLMSCSCGTSQNIPSTDLAIVTLNGQNMPMLLGDEDTIQSYLETACSADTGSSISVIIADGSPYQVGSLSFDQKEAKNTNFWIKEQAARVESAIQLLNSTAVSPETNPLEAIRIAARSLQSGHAQQKLLIVAHSGICTTEPLPMQNLDLSMLEQLLPQLEAQGYLAALEGADVHWFYCGDTSGTQNDLSPIQVQQLRTFWQSYLEMSGAASVTFHEDLPTHEALDSAPAVSVLTTQELSFSFPVALDSNQLGFSPDSWEITDPEQATAQLSSLAQSLSTDPESRCILAGSTAEVEGSTLESSQAFSLKRAQQVKQILCNLGVPSDQLIALGIGNASTSVRSAEPAANRVVWIVPASDPLAQEFLAAGLPEEALG